MSQLAKQFLAGAFGLIALFLILSNSGGLDRSIKAAAGGSATVFKTLQGRG